MNLSSGKPVMFCVLTDDNEAQTEARSGGVHGNKGVKRPPAFFTCSRSSAPHFILNTFHVPSTLDRGLLATTVTSALGQYPGWQQAVSYDMQATLDTASHQYQGVAKVIQEQQPRNLGQGVLALVLQRLPTWKHDGRPLTHHRRPRPPGGQPHCGIARGEWGWIHMEQVKAFGQDAEFEEDGTVLVVDLPRRFVLGSR